MAEGVRKHGGHYQAALSWAVYNPDPSIYNVQWAVDFFRECVAMGTVFSHTSCSHYVWENDDE